MFVVSLQKSDIEKTIEELKNKNVDPFNGE